MDEKLYKIGRTKTTPYIGYYLKDDKREKFVWNGYNVNTGKMDVKELREEVVMYFRDQTSAIRDGELRIMDDAVELLEEMTEDDLTGQLNNTHTVEEIKELLNKGVAEIRDELAKITVQTEKNHVISVIKANTENLTKPKLKAISEWAGISEDVLFAE